MKKEIQQRGCSKKTLLYKQVSLTMPARLLTHSRGAVHSIFEQNLPEGFVRDCIAERLRKHIRIKYCLYRMLRDSFNIIQDHYRLTC